MVSGRGQKNSCFIVHVTDKQTDRQRNREKERRQTDMHTSKRMEVDTQQNEGSGIVGR